MGTLISVSAKKTKQEEFDAIYREYSPKVNAFYLSRVNDIKTAEDLTGEVFLYCYEHYDSYNAELSSISTWIYMISNSRWKNYCRDLRRTENIDELGDIFEDDSSDIEHAVWLESMKDELRTALSSLTERQQQIIVLKYYKGMSAAEIAELLGTNDNNIRVQLSKALKTMKKYMKDLME